MRKIVEVENSKEFDELLGEEVIVWCCRWIYAGKLVGANDKYIVLGNCQAVFDRGDNTKPTFTYAESLGDQWYVRTEAIESYGRKPK